MDRSGNKIKILCDFDGTITNDDIGFRIIETFAGPGWREIEDAYQRGEKGSREALLEIFAITSVSEDTLRDFIEKNFRVDPAFHLFLNFCRSRHIAVTVLSDGFDYYIDMMFSKYSVDVPYVANRLRVVDTVLNADFPHNSGNCGACGNCKLSYAEKVKREGNQIIYIGDGYSDRCVSSLADVVFAKGVLAEHCSKQGIDFFPFENFQDILKICRSGLIKSLPIQEGRYENCP